MNFFPVTDFTKMEIDNYTVFINHEYTSGVGICNDFIKKHPNIKTKHHSGEDALFELLYDFYNKGYYQDALDSEIRKYHYATYIYYQNLELVFERKSIVVHTSIGYEEKIHKFDIMVLTSIYR